MTDKEKLNGIYQALDELVYGTEDQPGENIVPIKLEDVRLIWNNVCQLYSSLSEYERIARSASKELNIALTTSSELL